MKKSLLLIAFAGLLLTSGCGRLNGGELPTPVPTPTLSPLEITQNAISLRRANDFAGAEEMFFQVIEIFPDYGPAYSQLALTQLWQGEHLHQAVENAEKAVELSPEDAFSHAVLAYANTFQHHSEKAAASAEQAFQLDPDDEFVQMAAVLALVGDYQYDRAWEILKSAYTQTGETAEVYIALGQYFLASDDFGHAQAAFIRAVELEPEFVVWQQYLAEFYFRTARYSEIDPVLERTLETVPDYLPGLYLLGKVDIERFEFLAVEQIIETISAQYPESDAVDLLLGDLNLAQEKYQQALDSYQRILESDSKDYSALIGVGRVHLAQGDCRPAATIYDQALPWYPLDVGLLTAKGFSLLCEDKPEDAVSLFDEALQIDPFSEEATLGLAESYLVQDEWDQALEVLRAALGIEPAVGKVHALLGRLALAQGMLSSAEAEFRMALELDQYDLRTYIQLADVLSMQSRTREAIDLVDQAVEIFPDYSAAVQMLGFLHYVSADTSQAEDYIERAMSAKPKDANLHLFKALIQRDLGNFDAAAGTIEDYLDLINEQSKGLLQNAQVNLLLEALKEGYYLDRQEGLSMVQEHLRMILGYNPRIWIEEDPEHGSTLNISMIVTPMDYEDQTYLIELSAVIWTMGFYLPRLEPVVDNGLLVDVNTGSRQLLVARQTYSNLKYFADTLYGTEELIDLTAFDFPDSHVQRSTVLNIIQDVAVIRDLDIDQIPEYEVISTDQLSGHLEEDYDEEYYQDLDYDYAVLVMLGLMPADLDFADVQGDYLNEVVGGFYTGGEKKIYVVSNGEFTSSDVITIAHESEHALADQVFDLGTIQARTTDTDRDLAALALVEGDASFVSHLYLDQFIPEFGWWSAGIDINDSSQQEPNHFPAYLIETSNFPYSYGQDFVTFMFNQGGWRQVNEIFWDPPISTEQIMHPQKYLDGDTPHRVYLEKVSTALESSWQVLDEDVMGEFGIFLTLAEYFGKPAAAPAAEGWGGDRYLLMENLDGGEQVFVWSTVWDDFDEAQGFLDSFTTAMYHRNEYHELVDNFVRIPNLRIWQSDAGYLIALKFDDQVVILIGENYDHLTSILDVID